MQEKSIETKIAVIESQLESHAQYLLNNQDTTEKLVDKLESHIKDSHSSMSRMVDKLDLHIQSSQARDASLQTGLVESSIAITSLTNAVDRINPMLESLCITAADSKERLVKWDAAWKTIAKIFTVATIFITAMWAFFTFMIEHPQVMRPNNPSAVVSADE